MSLRPTSRLIVVASFAICCAVLRSLAAASPIPASAAMRAGAKVSFKIVVPARALQSQRVRAVGRARPQYISASTESLTVLTDGANPLNVNLTPGSPSCKSEPYGTACKLLLNTTPTTHVFSVKTFDGPNSTGNLLSLNSTGPITVKPSGTTVALALQGVVENLVLSVTIPYPDSGSAAAIPLAAVAQDADGNIIVGSAAFANPVVLNTSDAVNGAPSKSVLSSPADEQGLTVAYSGAQTAAIRISGTAAGLRGTVVPAFITPTPPTTSKLYAIEATVDVKVFRTKNLGLPPSVIDVYPPNKSLGLAVDPASHRLYLPNYTSYLSTVLPGGDVGVYDTDNLGFLGYAVFGGNPEVGWLGAAAFDAANSTLYIGTQQFGDNRTIIYAADTATNFQTVGGFGVPFVTIQGLAVDPAAGVLYAAVGYPFPTVIVYSTASGNPQVGQITGLTFPEAVAVDARAGKVYVADDFTVSPPGGAVRVYSSASTHPLLSTIAGLRNPQGVAVDPLAGKLYVSEAGGYVAGTGEVPPDIKVFSTAGGYPLLATITNISAAGQIAVTP